MTAQEIQKRNETAQQLRVIQVDDANFYVESSEGKICYKVTFTAERPLCTCGDFARNGKHNAQFQCKHIMAVMNCEVGENYQKSEFLERKKTRLDDRFIMNLKGKDFVLYAGLLDLAHQRGLLKMEVETIQFPTKDNGKEAICRAIATSSTGEVFSDIGDANPGNCNKLIAPHVLRMASTRAKARALRDMTNIGMTCLEELGDLDDVIGSDTPKKTTTRKSRTSKASNADNGNGGKGSTKKNESATDTGTPADSKPATSSAKQTRSTKASANDEQPTLGEQPTLPGMSEAQKRAIHNLSRRRGISVEDLENMAMSNYQCNLDGLSSQNASQLIRLLQQSA